MRLGVNVDHVATVRQARRERWPDPTEAALVAARAGADQITVHLREDRRHIQDRDVKQIQQIVAVPLNLEMAAVAAMVSLAVTLQPRSVTLVPERREEVTTEGGLNLFADAETLRARIHLLRDADIRVSVFVDADVAQVRQAHKLGVDALELHTGRFANAFADGTDWTAPWNELAQAARLAAKVGIEVAAGHGLTLRSAPLLKGIAEIVELNIGHALIADAIFHGLEATVQRYRAAIRRG